MTHIFLQALHRKKKKKVGKAEDFFPFPTCHLQLILNEHVMDW